MYLCMWHLVEMILMMSEYLKYLNVHKSTIWKKAMALMGQLSKIDNVIRECTYACDS